jgi:hypothetical protein
VDFSITGVTPCPTTAEKIAVAVAVLFPLIALPLAIQCRRLGPAFTLVPMLAGGAAAYVQLGTVLLVMALTTTRVGAAVAAGLATAQVSLLAGVCASVLTALIAAFVARRHPNAAQPNRIALWVAVVACAVIAVEPPFTFVFVRYASYELFTIVAAFVAVGAIAALIASRGAAARPLLIAAACEACVGVEAWLVLRHFERIAIYGR